MKKNTLQTKRRSKSGFRAIYAKTIAGKKQRVATTATPEDLDAEVPSVGIGRALTVILVLHVIAIAAIYIGTQWQDDKEPTGNSAVVTDQENKSNNINGTPPAGATPGALTVDEPGSLQLPEDRPARPSNNDRVVADNGGEVSDRPATDTGEAAQPERRQPRLIKSRRDEHVPQPGRAIIVEDAPASFTTYTIKSGDNFYRIAKKYDIKQQELMDLNKDVDPRKLRPGMKIKLPKK